jgi:phosphatidylserine decarboxylase
VAPDAPASTARLHRREDKPGIWVVDRQTGKATLEDTPAYVLLGMKAVFHSWLIFSPFIRLHLAIQTRRQGAYKDSLASVAEIPAFISTYKLPTADLLRPDPKNYTSFNDFFARELKPGARPIDPDPAALVSAADCRLTVFPTVEDATRIWIKGAHFSVVAMLGGDQQLADKFVGGSIAVFRLAPQDYHRYHSPVEAKVVENRDFKGAYYTVNPVAVRTELDVFTENRRLVTILESPQFGTVAFVQVGALLVGSIRLTGAQQAGAVLAKGAEMGYFAYGGSTVVAVFQKGKVVFDADLVKNSLNERETLLQVGQRIGKTA